MDMKTSKNYRNYRKYTFLLLIAAAVALALAAVSSTFKREALATQGNPEKNFSSYYTPNPTPSQENSRVSSALEEEGYLVTVYDGKIGVYRQGETSPFLTADVDVYLLPGADVKLLKEGIPAKTFGEVKSILEDYE